MWKLIGVLSLFGGMAGLLHNWIATEHEKVRCLEDMILFLQKSVYMMKKEKLKVADYFQRYMEQELSVKECKNVWLEIALTEMIKRLSANTYPYGQIVWEEVFREEEQNLQFDREVFEIIVRAGNAFFGRSREENVVFLEKSIEELEIQLSNMKEKGRQERKVWIPVGMLGTLMVIILFL